MLKSLSSFLIALMVGGLLSIGHPALAAALKPTSADTALAFCFYEQAESLRLQANAAAPTSATVSRLRLREAAALLEAAARLNPAEPLYRRAQADIYRSIGEVNGELTALNALRQLRPQDQSVQVRVIQLHVDRMQTLPQQVEYLQSLLSKTVVAPEVRSSAAARCAVLLMQKGDREEAMRVADEAIKLNPLNMTALSLKYKNLSPAATPAERVGLLLAMVRSNPSRDDVLNLLARESATAGLVTDSVLWYRWLSIALQGSTNRLPPLVDGFSDWRLDYIAQLLLTGQAEGLKEARSTLDAILTIVPDHHEALLLRMFVANREGEKDTADKFRNQARNVLLNRLAVARQQIGVPSATTQPVREESPAQMPDIAGDVELLKKKATDPALVGNWLGRTADLAWFLIYFDHRVDDAARLLKVRSAVADPADPAERLLDARFRGWMLLEQRRPAEAANALRAAEGKNLFADLGLLRTMDNGADAARIKAAASKLLTDYPAGLQAVLLRDALRDVEASPAPTARGIAIKPLLDEFLTRSGDILTILTQPRRFYSLQADVRRVNHVYGEPMLATITLRNTSLHDLTIGEGGLLDPTIWLDARTGNPNPRTFVATGYESIGEKLVLRRTDRIEVTTLVNQGELARYLDENVMPSIGIVMSLRSNASDLGQAGACGPAGYSLEFSRMINRSPCERTMEGLTKLRADAAGADPVVRIRNLEILARCNEQFREQSEAEVKALMDLFVDTLRKAQSDADPSVRAWAGFLLTRHGPEREKAITLERALRDTAWQTRLMGLVAVDVLAAEGKGLPNDVRKSMLTELAPRESEPLVKNYLADMQQILAAPTPPSRR